MKIVNKFVVLDEIAQIEEVVNKNEDFTSIISVLKDVTENYLVLGAS